MERSVLLYACLINRIFGYRRLEAARLMRRLFPPDSSVPETDGRILFPDIGPLAEQLCSPREREAAERELEWCERHRIRTVPLGSPEYPSRLAECEDAPVLLYLQGDGDPDPHRNIAVVGTRRPTPQGRLAVRQILEACSLLSPPPSIVSGLAYGIDIEAHRAALELGLQTCGVMATGPDRIYPAVHRSDAVRILPRGCLVTEFPPGTPPYPLHFLQRNRIIAGLCDAVILCESGERGGGMATARQAASYNREVFALPGRMDDPLSKGCNLLIKNNIATIITSPESWMESLGWEKREKRKRNLPENPGEIRIFERPAETAGVILDRLRHSPLLDSEELLEQTGLAAENLAIALTALEVEGLVRRDASGRYAATGF